MILDLLITHLNKINVLFTHIWKIILSYKILVLIIIEVNHNKIDNGNGRIINLIRPNSEILSKFKILWNYLTLVDI